MTNIKTRIAVLALSTLGSSAFATVIMPTNSADGGYTATGAVQTMQGIDTSRMGASAAKPNAHARTDVFMTADGSPMGLAGGAAAEMHRQHLADRTGMPGSSVKGGNAN